MILTNFMLYGCFWPISETLKVPCLALFEKCQVFWKHSILIICHFHHFFLLSFSWKSFFSWKRFFLNFPPRLTRLTFFGCFPRQNWNFEDPKFWPKPKRNALFPLNNFWNCSSSSHYESKIIHFKKIPEHLSLYEMEMSGNYSLIIFRRLKKHKKIWTLYRAVFKYHSKERQT